MYETTNPGIVNLAQKYLEQNGVTPDLRWALKFWFICHHPTMFASGCFNSKDLTFVMIVRVMTPIPL